jgi:hypothetical protein
MIATVLFFFSRKMIPGGANALLLVPCIYLSAIFYLPALRIQAYADGQPFAEVYLHSARTRIYPRLHLSTVFVLLDSYSVQGRQQVKTFKSTMGS